MLAKKLHQSIHNAGTSTQIPRGLYDTDVSVTGAAVYFIPVVTRVPLKFGAEVLTSVTCCRVRLTVQSADGREAIGWGETPLSVQWGWPSSEAYSIRHETMKDLCLQIAEAWIRLPEFGHPLELGIRFQTSVLPQVVKKLKGGVVPYLAALICTSAFDLALHDAYGNLHELDIYSTYTEKFLSCDLSTYFNHEKNTRNGFEGRFPVDFLTSEVPCALPVWHLVGGLDALTTHDVENRQPLNDNYPVCLTDWIATDGLKCLKIKLRGNDYNWDFSRLVRVAELSIPLGVTSFSADFNCTVNAPSYVVRILDQLQREFPEAFERLLYIEQPFPYDLHSNSHDVSCIAERKPIFLDESAHDWSHVAMGRSMGWTGVALKTCKTQSGSLLSCCWAKAHGMQLMVQDLTNPMLAMLPHVRLAAHVGTLMGVEANAMQFYPDASLPEAEVHPGLYRRRDGMLHLDTIRGAGFGYRIDEIHRKLPKPACELKFE